MPRKHLSVARAPHDGSVYFSLNLKLWQTVISILLGLIALYAAARTAVSRIVASTVAEQVREEILKQYKPGLDEWKRGIEGQLTGLRRADAETRAAIRKLQERDLKILETMAGHNN